jgi:hypothetical protein
VVKGGDPVLHVLGPSAWAWLISCRFWARVLGLRTTSRPKPDLVDIGISMSKKVTIKIIIILKIKK